MAERGDALDLAERLREIADRLTLTAPVYSEQAAVFVSRLTQAHVGATAPKPGERFPEFLMPDVGGRLVGLRDLVGGGPLAIVFQRGQWCPFCRAQTDAINAAQERLHAAGARVAIITPSVARFAGKVLERAGHAAVLCDLDAGFAASLGLVAAMHPALCATLAAEGVDLAALQSGSWIVPIPATFVLDAHGVVLAREIFPDYRRRGDVGELVAAVSAARAP